MSFLYIRRLSLLVAFSSTFIATAAAMHGLWKIWTINLVIILAASILSVLSYHIKD